MDDYYSSYNQVIDKAMYRGWAKHAKSHVQIGLLYAVYVVMIYVHSFRD